jgi:hypothetical protein
METLGHSKIHVATLHSSIQAKIEGILYYFVYNNENIICGTVFFFFFWVLNSNEFFSLKEITLRKPKKFKFFSKSTSQNDKVELLVCGISAAERERESTKTEEE